jgi:hypothetical protein
MPLLYAAPPQNIAPLAISERSAASIVCTWHAPHASRAMR